MQIYTLSVEILLIIFIQPWEYSSALYDADTDRGIYILNEENFNVTVFQSISPNGKRASENLTWVIQFYNSWCGHCIRFSPVFKGLGSKTQHWGNFLRLGTVDCSHEYNRALCNRFHVFQTPTFRSFSPLSSSDSQGDDMEIQRTLAENLHEILDVMESSGVPNDFVALPEKSLDNVWATIPSNVTALAIVVESIGSSVAKECILHLLPNLHVLMVKRAYSTNRVLLNSLTIEPQTPLPFLVFLERNLPGQRGILTLSKLKDDNPVRAFAGAILRADEELTRRRNINRRPRIEPIFDANIQEPYRQKNYSPSSDHPQAVKVSIHDINSAVTYALSSEIGRLDDIKGNKFEALKRFVQSVVKLLPLRSDILMALRQLETSLLRRNFTKGTDVLRILQESGLDYSDSRIEWVNCRGSVPERRGYPCGLWQVFHMMTVKSHEQSSESNSLGPDGALTAVIGYIEHIFSCGDCSRNFMKHVNNFRKTTQSMSNADAVLFLWRAHNHANRRLSGDFTEDPAYPKIQFPSLAQCNTCRKTIDPNAAHIVWDESAVLRYLLQFYS